jgi:hypothetical protein
MDEHLTDDDDAERPPTPDDSAPPLTAKIVASADRPTECTLFPPEASDFERMTTWITAKAGSFVGLDDVR